MARPVTEFMAQPVPDYATALGRAYQGDSLAVMPQVLPGDSVDLVFTSPPYALTRQKIGFSNVSAEEYTEWFRPFAREVHRVLRPTGSLVLNLGGTWTPGQPTKNLYQYKALLDLVDGLGFHLAQEFFWHNPAKMPAPAEWVTVRRVRVKDSVEYLFWLSKTPHPKANNRKVLRPYSDSMVAAIAGPRRAAAKHPSGHRLRGDINTDRGGAIPPNLIVAANTESTSRYMRRTRAAGHKIHPARFPAALPRFFTEFLTDPGDLVVDIFAGSNTTGAVAESLGRRWVAIELDPAYVANSRLRFDP